MKKVIHTMKFEIKGGEARPGMQLAPLSSKGIKAMDFCKAFNELTQKDKGRLMRARILQYEDKSYTFTLNYTPTSKLILEAVKLEKGSSEPNRTKVASITKKEVEEVAKKKKKDGNAFELSSLIKSVEGTARSMGIIITD